MRTFSESRKAVREREVRRRTSSERHFNRPLSHFIQHKYKAIYEEYAMLYNRMIVNHPRRRNLVTSTTFKEWQASTPPGNTTQTQAILNRAWEETVAAEATAAVVNLQAEQRGEQITRSEILPQPQPEENISQNSNEDNDIRQQLDDIVNELLQEDVLRDIFHQPEPVDEGIELNIIDKIEGDIEPFDFEAELEQSDLYDL